VVCISIPDEAADGGATALLGTASGYGATPLPNTATNGSTTPPSPMQQQAAAPPPSLTHLQAVRPPLPWLIYRRRVHPLPGVAKGGAPTPTPFLPWSAATGVEVWRICSRS
jgi:hypothetical protein